MTEITKEMMEKYPKQFEELASKLKKDDEYKLPKVLQEKLDSIKNTPLDELKIDKKMKDSIAALETGEIQSDEVNIEIVEAIYSVDEIQNLLDTDCKLKDVAEFGARVINKIFPFRDEKEELKEVSSHKNLKPLAYLEKKELRKIVNKLRNLFTGANPYTPENLEKLQEITKEVEAYVLRKCSYLDLDSMTKWEKDLLIEKVKANATGNYEPQMGKN